MAGSVNKVFLVGNVGKDPEIRFMPDGSKVANFSIATSETWKDKNSGERRERTEWHRISIMNEKLAEIAEKYIRKGSKVCVEGQLQTRKWTDQSGVEKATTEVLLGRYKGELTLLDNRSNSNDYMGDDDGHTSMEYSKPSTKPSVQSLADLDDDMPF